MDNFLKIKPYQRLLVVLFILLVAVSIAWFVALMQRDKAREVRQQQFGDGYITRAAEATLPENSISNQRASTGEPQRTYQQIKVVDDWFKEVGFSTERQKTYELQYTEEQLQSLVDQGDIIAMDALLNKIQLRDWQEFEQKMLAFNAEGDTEGMATYLNSRRLRDESKQLNLIEKGITYGSFNAITAMERKLRPTFLTDDPPEVRHANKQQLLEQLSYIELLRLRGAGGLYSINVDERVDLEYFENQYGEKLITDDDRKKINGRAKELYDYYQSERHKLGLGDFDNSMPNEVRDFLGE